MFRKEFYQDFYREKMRYCEDYDFYFRIMTDNLKMANLDECLRIPDPAELSPESRIKSSKTFSSINRKFFTKND
jgi:hypothetical protein